LLTANNAGRSSSIASSTATPRIPITTRSSADVVVSEPNRYCTRLALPLSSDSPTSTTPPAIPP
jgi:hypothetical protein